MNIRDWTQCFLNIATLYNIKQDVLSNMLHKPITPFKQKKDVSINVKIMLLNIIIHNKYLGYAQLKVKNFVEMQ